MKPANGGSTVAFGNKSSSEEMEKKYMRKVFLLRSVAQLIIFAICFMDRPLQAQNNDDAVFPPGLRSLSSSKQFPEDLLYTKSVVFVNDRNQKDAAAWKELSVQAHNTFREAGIDAVAYYYFDDVKAGRDVSRKLAEALSQRQIKNIVVISRDKKGCGLAITPFNGNAFFFDKNQQAYKQTASSCDQLFIELGKVAYRNKAEVQNYLINDQPEFFVGAGSVVKGRRAEAFAQDLKLDKLAVPKFQEDDLSSMQNPLPGVADTSQVNRLNESLENIMADYPYEYALVDPDIAEDKLRQDSGYQFILLKLHTTKAHIRDMLEYDEAAEGNEAETSAGNSTEDQASVYKYYVKHIYTGDVYLGDVWDASKDWKEALNNYIHNMRQSLNISE